MPPWIEKILPILILLMVVGGVLSRLPNVEGVTHDSQFRRRRVMNWLPLGLTYAFLYMARYNIKVSQLAFGDMPNSAGQPMMDNADFSFIFGVGTLVYGCAFVINGPLTDKYGGRFAILVGAGGSLVMNGLMGVFTYLLVTGAPTDTSVATEQYTFVSDNFRLIFTVLYAVNMYFQAFGAVAVVKVNAPWFHLRERGVFGAIFGILISLGVYFAFDWGYLIVKTLPLYYVFWIPTSILIVLWVIVSQVVKNTPGEAGLQDFDLGDASDDDGPALSTPQVFYKMLTNPIIMTIAFIEFCSGFLRQAIMQWFRVFAKQTDSLLHLKDGFVYENWGLLLCCAGILGGVFAGVISDRVFQSRRGPVAAVLYGGMLIGTIALTFLYNTAYVGPLVLVLSMFVIGVHGMLSGTASMDFGGKKNVGVAVGIIDGFVYAGTALMSLTYYFVLPNPQLDPVTGAFIGESTDPANWYLWPASMVPFALIGLLLATRLWNAKPKAKAKTDAKDGPPAPTQGTAPSKDNPYESPS